ncbi:unnamed protein product [Thelazia callipaeda]|uniref:Tudor domain-containing protein n=1 Tax=Thelazia callipaeda TaxID=103827 RepID=A0A0N5CME8_THECL|nr:unnamed protein product [Thelazia callipaeda]
MEYVMQGNEDAEESPRETESNRTDAAAGGDNDGLSMQDECNFLGHTVHLVYSEYDDPPSETAVEVIEGPQHYWWSSVKSPDQEVCLVYSEYSEPSTETSIDMDQFFNDKKKTGREVRLVYSECEEPPSETDVEYDGRPWCSLFGQDLRFLLGYEKVYLGNRI